MDFLKSLLSAIDSRKPRQLLKKTRLSPLERAQMQNCRDNCGWRKAMLDVETLQREHCSMCEIEWLIEEERKAREGLLDE